MEHTISSLVRGYLDTGNEDYFEQLQKRFAPLIKAYARKLYYLEYEDSLQELNIALYEAISKMPSLNNEYACISYIKKSVVNKFTKLYHASVKNQAIQAKCISLEDFDGRDYLHDYEVDNCISLLDLERILKNKQPSEQELLRMLISGYNDKEIAEKLGYTRQYVNRIKKKIWQPESAR